MGKGLWVVLIVLLSVGTAQATLIAGGHPAQQELIERFPQITFVGAELFSDDGVVRVEHGASRMIMRGMPDPSAMTEARMLIVHDEPITTDIAVAENADVEYSTIRLAKRGPVAAVARCEEFIVGDGCLSGWEETGIPFTDRGEYIEFVVDHFSSYGGIAQAERLYVSDSGTVTHPSVPATSSLASSRAGTLDQVGTQMSSGTLYTFVNASGASANGGTIRTTDQIDFSSYWDTGNRVDAAHATFKLYVNGTLVCQSGDDSTGGVQLPDGATGLRTGSCFPAQNHTISVGTPINYVVDVWAQTIGGGPASGQTATLQWDTATADTWVNIPSVLQAEVDALAADMNQGENTSVTGTFGWQNGTGIGNKNVTVIFINTTGGIVQSRNVTTDTVGTYSDTYALPNDASTGNWSVNVTGWYNSTLYATATDIFTVINPPPVVHWTTIAMNPAANGTSVTITANLTDNSAISTVTAEVYYPNGTLWQNISMAGPNPYNTTFTTLLAPLGNFSTSVWANDSQGSSTRSAAVALVVYVTLSGHSEIVVDGAFMDWTSQINDPDDQFSAPLDWRLLNVPNPLLRYDHAMVFDPVLDTSLVFGGTGPSSCDGSFFDCNGTYAYNRSSGSWSMLPAANPPTSRREMGVAFDPTLNMTMIFGGFATISCDGTGESECNSTYAFNASNFSWSLLPVANSPSARGDLELVFDPLMNRTLLFGGAASSSCDGSGSQYCNGTYAFNAANLSWSPVPATNPPTGRRDHAMVFDPVMNATLLFGGEEWPSVNSSCDGSGSTFCNGTYAFNATNLSWSLLPVANPPSAREGHGMVFDSALNMTLLFGGEAESGSCDGSGTVYCNGTYAFNASDLSWSLLPLTNPPSARHSHGMVFDPVMDGTLLSGGLGTFAACGTENSLCDGPYALNSRDHEYLDVLGVAVANNDSDLLVYASFNDSMRTAGHYRVFFGVPSSSDSRSPTEEAMPFMYSWYADVNGEACVVYNASDEQQDSCDYAINGSQVELGVSLSTLGIVAGGSVNVTLEPATDTTSIEFAPDMSSFISYTVDPGTTLAITVSTDQPVYGPNDLVIAIGNFTDNNSPLVGKNVTVTFSNLISGVVQERNVTTNGTGWYTDNYQLPAPVQEGYWTVLVTGWNSTDSTITGSAVFIVDDLPPDVWSINFSQNPAPNGTIITVSANITDDVSVDSAYLELRRPDGSLWQNFSMVGPNPYAQTFIVAEYPTGNYTATIRANDTLGQVNGTESAEFVPYISLTQFAAINVDGSFSDWENISMALDPFDGEIEAPGASNTAFWRPYKILATGEEVNNPENILDRSINDSTTFSYLSAMGDGSPNPPTSRVFADFKLFPNTTNATLTYTWQTEGLNGNLVLLVFNYSMNGYFNYDNSASTLQTDQYVLSPHQIAPNGTVLMGFQASGQKGGMGIGSGYVYDVNIQTPGETLDFLNVSSPSSTNNASYNETASSAPICADGWCVEGEEFVDGSDTSDTGYHDVWYIENGANATMTNYSAGGSGYAWENYHFRAGSVAEELSVEWRGSYATTSEFNISIWNATSAQWSEIYNATDNQTDAVITWESMTEDVVDDYGQVHLLALSGTGRIQTDYVRVNIPNGSTTIDIREVAFANNETHLFTRISGSNLVPDNDVVIAAYFETQSGLSNGIDGPLPYSYVTNIQLGGTLTSSFSVNTSSNVSGTAETGNLSDFAPVMDVYVTEREVVPNGSVLFLNSSGPVNRPLTIRSTDIVEIYAEWNTLEVSSVTYITSRVFKVNDSERTLICNVGDGDLSGMALPQGMEISDFYSCSPDTDIQLTDTDRISVELSAFADPATTGNLTHITSGMRFQITGIPEEDCWVTNYFPCTYSVSGDGVEIATALDDIAVPMPVMNVSVEVASGGSRSDIAPDLGSFISYTVASGDNPPLISNVRAENVTSTGAQVHWSTNLLSNTTIEYGTTSLDLAAGQNDWVTSHMVTLTGLSPTTTYYYRVTSCNNNGCTTSPILTFETMLAEHICDFRYEERGPNWQEGLLQEGDEVVLECALDVPIGEREDVAVRLFWNDVESSRMAHTPRLMYRDEEVLYP